MSLILIIKKIYFSNFNYKFKDCIFLFPLSFSFSILLLMRRRRQPLVVTPMMTIFFPVFSSSLCSSFLPQPSRYFLRFYSVYFVVIIIIIGWLKFDVNIIGPLEFIKSMTKYLYLQIFNNLVIEL